MGLDGGRNERLHWGHRLGLGEGNTPRSQPKLPESPLRCLHTALGGQALLVRATLHRAQRGLIRAAQPFSQSHTAISGRTQMLLGLQGYSCAHIWAHGDIEINSRLEVVRPSHLGCKARPTPSAGRSPLDTCQMHSGCSLMMLGGLGRTPPVLRPQKNIKLRPERIPPRLRPGRTPPQC